MNIFQYVSIGLKGVTGTVDADLQTQVGLCKIRPRVREWQGGAPSIRATVEGSYSESHRQQEELAKLRVSLLDSEGATFHLFPLHDG